MSRQILKHDKNFEADLVVCGGGLAGVMCAVAAAREGKSVILVEKYGCLGGMATSGLVYPFMRHTQTGDGAVANAGLYFELLERIHALGGSSEEHSRHYRDEYMKIVLDRMTKEYGIKVLFHSRLCGTEREGREIKGISVATVSGIVKITGKVFADTTGNAELCAYAGLPFEMGRESDSLCQPMTLCFRIGGVDWSRFDRAEANRKYKEFQKEGKILNPREDVLVFKHPLHGVMHMNTTRVSGLDPTDVEDVTYAEMTLREQMLEMVNFLRENISGMENCQLLYSAAEAGIRESRRIIGRTVINADDIVTARKFEDSIARGTYEIDIHNPTGGGTTHIGVPDNDYYTIPYSALLPVDCDNLIVAGRAISTTHEALAAVRIMPITTCMGEAAGIAASMAIDGGKRLSDIDLSLLQEKIRSYGGLV